MTPLVEHVWGALLSKCDLRRKKTSDKKIYQDKKFFKLISRTPKFWGAQIKKLHNTMLLEFDCIGGDLFFV